jgi:ATP-dependent DNA helicase RecG
MSAMEDTARLLRRLLDEDRESAWLEFKTNLADPQQIGEYVSALANGAALEGRSHGYLVWGVDDATHEIV